MGEACKFSSRLLRVRRSRLTLKLVTRSTMSRQKSKIKKAFLQINSVSSSLANSWKMGVPSQTTIFKKSRHCIWCCGCEVGVDAKRGAYYSCEWLSGVQHPNDSSPFLL